MREQNKFLHATQTAIYVESSVNKSINMKTIVSCTVAIVFVLFLLGKG